MSAPALTIDDSASMRQLVAIALKSAGFQVKEAPNGKEGLSIACAQPLSLIVTDLHMPLMNGLEFITAVRKLPIHRFTPILFLTTESDDGRKREARAAGATGWIVKPFTQDQLLSAVRRVVK